MDFFGDDFAFGDTPTLNKRNSNSAKKISNFDNASKKSNKGVDEIDDLLDDLLTKQQNKKSRRQNLQPYSSQNLAQPPILDSFRKTTDKFNIGGGNSQTQTDFNFMSKPPKIGFGQRKLISQDLMSQDNKSYNSGATGKGKDRDRERGQFFGFDGTNTMKNDSKEGQYQPSVSMRGNMRPPLKRKNQSRQPSILNEDRSVTKFNDNFGSINDLDVMSVTPNPPRRSNLNIQQTKSKDQDITNFKVFDLTDSKAKNRKESQTQVKQKIIQKTVIVKEQSKQVKQRHQAQIKMMKDSYQRQIQVMQQKYQKLLRQEKQSHIKQLRQNQRIQDQEQRKNQKLIKNQTDRIKQLYQWQNKKKCQAYQIEIERMKKLLQLSISKQPIQKGGSSIQQEKYQLMLKQKDFQRQRKLLQQKAVVIEQKRRQIQSQQHQFQLRKRTEQERLNFQKKKLFQYESEIRKRQMEQKSILLTQKQNMASQMANIELLSHQNKQKIREERQKLNLDRRLFQQQKNQYENFNGKFIDEYKMKQKQLQIQKQKLQNLQIQLYRKVNTVEMMALQKGITKNTLNLNNTQRRTELGRTQSVYSTAYKQNERNRSNSELDSKIKETQNRYANIEAKVNQNAKDRYSSKGRQTNDINRSGVVGGSKIHLQKYIQKLTRDKIGTNLS